MTVKLIAIRRPNYEHHSLGTYELEVIPRKGEVVWCETDGSEGQIAYRVDSVHYFVAPKSITEIYMLQVDEE